MKLFYTDDFSGLYFRRDRIKTLWLLLAVGIVYLPFLNNPFIFDDFALMGNNGIASIYADSHFNFSFRWLSYTSLGVTWVFAGDAPPVFRLQNLLIHGMNVLLLLQVLRLWIGLFVEEQSARKMANWGAWLGALVFACHPLAAYGTGYLVQRSILMATMFTLVMHLAYFHGLLSGRKRYLALAVVSYFLALFSKEHSLLVPAILLPMTWCIRHKINASSRSLIATLVGFAVCGMIVVLAAKGIFGQLYEPNSAELVKGQSDLLEAHNLHLKSILTQSGLYFKYCLLMILPNPAWMSIDMREGFVTDLSVWKNWAGIVAYGCYGLGALWCLFRGGNLALFGLALLYPWCIFPTEFASVRVQEIFVLYRAYLWMPGMMLLFPLALNIFPERKIILAGVLAAILLIPMAWNRLWVFGDLYRLWDDAVVLLDGKDKLGAHRTYYNRAQASMEKKDYASAITDYRKSIAINSTYPEVGLALAAALAKTNRIDEAAEEYDKLITSNPDNARAYFGKAILANLKHDDEVTTRLMKKSCGLGLNEACGILAMIELKKEKGKSGAIAGKQYK